MFRIALHCATGPANVRIVTSVSDAAAEPVNLNWRITMSVQSRILSNALSATDTAITSAIRYLANAPVAERAPVMTIIAERFAASKTEDLHVVCKTDTLARAVDAWQSALNTKLDATQTVQLRDLCHNWINLFRVLGCRTNKETGTPVYPAIATAYSTYKITARIGRPGTAVPDAPVITLERRKEPLAPPARHESVDYRGAWSSLADSLGLPAPKSQKELDSLRRTIARAMTRADDKPASVAKTGKRAA